MGVAAPDELNGGVDCLGCGVDCFDWLLDDGADGCFGCWPAVAVGSTVVVDVVVIGLSAVVAGGVGLTSCVPVCCLYLSRSREVDRSCRSTGRSACIFLGSGSIITFIPLLAI